jgi:uncharacterized membrane protein YvbJ
MFCQQCGSKCDESAKFCSACGASLAGGAAPEKVTPENTLDEKVFYNSAGIFVSDAVFKTATGESYPIRNISSVSVAIKPVNIIAVLLAVVLSLFGGFALMAGHEATALGLFVLVVAPMVG